MEKLKAVRKIQIYTMLCIAWICLLCSTIYDLHLWQYVNCELCCAENGSAFCAAQSMTCLHSTHTRYSCTALLTFTGKLKLHICKSSAKKVPKSTNKVVRLGSATTMMMVMVIYIKPIEIILTC